MLRSRRRRAAEQELDALQPDMLGAGEETEVDPETLVLCSEQTAGTQQAAP